MDDESDEHPWWKTATIYQIYPRSFNDTNGDGIGDIPGIVEKLDYVEDLGVDAIWLSPVYASQNVDNGYDVSDYRAIMDEFGTMADWERLLEEVHDRDMRLIMDMVVNHTSDEHEWFLEARRSAESEYRDYYFWREGTGEGGRSADDDTDGEIVGDRGAPPNDWEALWGGPAWTYDAEAGAYYLHLFHEKQAELDWRNPDVRDEVVDVVRWWLEKGVDGFRLDSINLISKPEGLPDVGPDGDRTGLGIVANGVDVHTHLQEVCERSIPSTDVVTIGETPNLSIEEARRYLGPDTDTLSMLLPFEHVELDRGEGARWAPRKWDLPELKAVVERWQTELAEDEWQGVYFNNHDQPRAVSRFGDEAYRRESATMLATLLFTLRGTPFVYQGEEIGMTNPRFERFDELRDVATKRSVEHAVERGDISGFEEVKDLVNRRTRDNARTPMQWTDGENAGFTDTDGEPWIKLADDYRAVNVEAARSNPDSVWHYYRRLVDLRGERDTLIHGDFTLLREDHPRLFSYLRTDGDERLLVVLNFSDDEGTTFEPPTSLEGETAEVLVGNYDRSVGGRVEETEIEGEDEDGEEGEDEDRAPNDTEDELEAIELRPYEARVYRLE
ncbi:glycoside hydrolase family 13 protein [Halomontanus rarus]|uniref:glycoside hydrolase family 13 protein n=1 Tax=Halomontanus rarus TaxID=3034020 RepID=UPI0023E84D06|nr:alpha-glucosidase [Halovivax sp. TS33]